MVQAPPTAKSNSDKLSHTDESLQDETLCLWIYIYFSFKTSHFILKEFTKHNVLRLMKILSSQLQLAELAEIFEETHGHPGGNIAQAKKLGLFSLKFDFFKISTGNAGHFSQFNIYTYEVFNLSLCNFRTQRQLLILYYNPDSFSALSPLQPSLCRSSSLKLICKNVCIL